MATAYLHLGTNQGSLVNNLKDAVKLLSAHGKVVAKSHIYETEAWGNTNQDNFYNAAIALNTKLSPIQLLEAIHTIEDKMGRERREKWEPRVIDIDIILYDDQLIVSEKLTIPHKHMHERAFVLIPLMEVAEDWMHPTHEKTIDEYFADCDDESEVLMIDEKL